MSVKPMNDLLGQHPFFDKMPEDFLTLMAGCAQNYICPAGEYIYRFGQEESSFYLIRHGEVSLEVPTPGRPPIIVETLSTNDILGWSWLVEPYQARFSARAKTLTRAILLDGKCLRRKMQEDHELGYQIYQRFVPVLADRLQAARLQMIDMYSTH